MGDIRRNRLGYTVEWLLLYLGPTCSRSSFVSVSRLQGAWGFLTLEGSGDRHYHQNSSDICLHLSILYDCVYVCPGLLPILLISFTLLLLAAPSVAPNEPGKVTLPCLLYINRPCCPGLPPFTIHLTY